MWNILKMKDYIIRYQQIEFIKEISYLGALFSSFGISSIVILLRR